MNETLYMNCDFIFGSAADVERLFNTARYVIPLNCRKKTLQLLEAICFPNENSDLWDTSLVVEAVHDVRKKLAEERLRSYEEDTAGEI